MPILLTLRDRQAANAAAVDAALAEPVQILFLASGLSDPSRTNVVVDMVLRTGAEQSPNYEGGASMRSEFSAGRSEARIDRASYQGPPVRQDDKLRALSRPGRPFFSVAAVNDRDATRLILTLTEA